MFFCFMEIVYTIYLLAVAFVLFLEEPEPKTDFRSFKVWFQRAWWGLGDLSDEMKDVQARVSELGQRCNSQRSFGKNFLRSRLE